MNLTIDPLRLALAAGLLLSYLALCLRLGWRARRVAAATAREAARRGAADWLVVHASQTGFAEQLAGQTAASLRAGGASVRLASISVLTADELKLAGRVLFIASTYGEGDAPDDAATFGRRVMAGALPLPQLRYAVLALGDSHYRHFCGFGRALDRWLARQGASALFGRIEVDRGAPAALAAWRGQLAALAAAAGTAQDTSGAAEAAQAGEADHADDAAADGDAPAFADWRLTARRLMNPGSAGAPLYHLELEPGRGGLPDWQSGDLAQIAAPADPQRPRDYSIASLPADGKLHLLVRVRARADGSAGLASGWLGVQVQPGQSVPLRVRRHRRFRLEENAARPLILIANGSGIAGLRAHLKARAQRGERRNWLIFGERHAHADFHYRDDIQGWVEAGLLPRLDTVFSREQPQRPYVQDRLLERAGALREWLAQGAAVYVCGSVQGMAAGVDRALETILGRAELDALAQQGRYRRDVY